MAAVEGTVFRTPLGKVEGHHPFATVGEKDPDQYLLPQDPFVADRFGLQGIAPPKADLFKPGLFEIDPGGPKEAAKKLFLALLEVA